MTRSIGATHHPQLGEKIRFQSGVGAAIRRLRMERKLTQSALAKLLGVSQSCVDNWEDGTAMVSGFQAWRLAHALDVTTDAILVDPPEVGEAAE